MRAESDGSVGQGMMRAGGALQQAGGVLSDISSKHQEMQDNRWVMESLSHARNAQSEYTSNPANNTSETYAANLKKFVDGEWAGYAKEAPSKEALAKFRQYYLGLSDSNYSSALDRTANTALTNTIEAIKKSGVEIGQTYLKERNSPGDANAKLLPNIQQVMQMTKEQLKVAPLIADKLNNEMIHDLTLLTVDYSPGLARKVMDMGTLDGATRHSLETTIKHAEESENLSSQLATDDSIKNYLSAAASGGQLEKFDHSIILGNYSRDKANHLISIVDNAYDLSQSIKTHKAEVAGGNAQALDRKDAELYKQWQDNPKEAKKHQEVYEVMHQALAAKKKFIEQDVVGYTQAENPVLKSLLSKAVASKNPQDYTDYLNALLSFQRAGPAEGPGKDLYHNLPREKWSVSSEGEAEANAAMFHGSPNDVFANIKKLRGQYQDKQHFQMALSDMMKLPAAKGIPSMYNVVLLHMDNDGNPDGLANGLVGAISKKEDILKMMPSGSTQADYDTALNSSPWLSSLQKYFSGDNYQQADLFTAYKDTVGLFAHTYGGMSPALAVEKAASSLLKDKMFLSHTGTIIPKDRPPGTDGRPQHPRSDAEAERLVNLLDLVKQIIDPLEINLTNKDGSLMIPQAENAGTPTAKQKFIGDQNTKFGEWHISTGGESATFYMGNGTKTWEARDHKNRAFVVNLQDLEKTDLFDLQPMIPGTYSGGRPSKYLGISPYVKESYDYNATHLPVATNLLKHIQR